MNRPLVVPCRECGRGPDALAHLASPLARRLHDYEPDPDSLEAVTLALAKAGQRALNLLESIGTGKWAKTPAGDDLRAVLPRAQKLGLL